MVDRAKWKEMRHTKPCWDPVNDPPSDLSSAYGSPINKLPGSILVLAQPCAPVSSICTELVS